MTEPPLEPSEPMPPLRDATSQPARPYQVYAPSSAASYSRPASVQPTPVSASGCVNLERPPGSVPATMNGGVHRIAARAGSMSLRPSSPLVSGGQQQYPLPRGSVGPFVRVRSAQQHSPAMILTPPPSQLAPPDPSPPVAYSTPSTSGAPHPTSITAATPLARPIAAAPAGRVPLRFTGPNGSASADTVAQPPKPKPTSAENVQKCARFFKTLLALTNKTDAQNSDNRAERVKALIESVIWGHIAPGEFTSSLQQILNSAAQPHLQPFLTANLPAVRHLLRTGQLIIEGISIFENEQQQQAGTQHDEQVETQTNQTLLSQSAVATASSPQVVVQQPLSQSLDGDQAAAATSTLTNSQLVVVESNGIGMTPEASTQQTLANTTTTADEETTSSSVFIEAPTNQLPFTFVNGLALWSRLANALPNCERIERDVVAKISEHVESRLRTLLVQLSDIAGHRLEPLRLDPHYKQINDPRKQLRFVEELEKQSYMRRTTLEQEAIEKQAKVSKVKDTTEKAKEMRRANQEEVLNREANEAAIAALGGSRGIKRAWGAYEPQKASNTIASIQRPQVRRVNVRDLQCALNCQNSADTAMLKFHLAYGLISASQPSASLTDT